MKVTFKTQIAVASDKDASRYALTNVCVGDGWATATNGRILAVASTTQTHGGENPPQLVPRDLCALKTSKNNRTVTIEDGKAQQVGARGAVTSLPLGDGRYPDCGEILPDADQFKEAKCISLDASLLLDLAKAINEFGNTGVTLIFDNANPGGGIGVIPAIPSKDLESAGVIMPLHHEKRNNEGCVKDYQHARTMASSFLRSTKEAGKQLEPTS